MVLVKWKLVVFVSHAISPSVQLVMLEKQLVKCVFKIPNLSMFLPLHLGADASATSIVLISNVWNAQLAV